MPDDSVGKSILGQKNLRANHEAATERRKKRAEDQGSILVDDSWNDVIIKQLSPERSVSILDVGCGTGRLICALLSKAPDADIVGIDISKEAIYECRNAFLQHKVGLIICSAEWLPLRGSLFDEMICKGVLHHLNAPYLCIEELSRVARENGLLLISEPSGHNPLLSALRRALVKFSSSYRLLHGSVREFTSQELTPILRQFSFVTLRKRYFGYAAFPAMGFPDVVAFTEILPIPRLWMALLRLDDILACVPIVKKLGWHLVLLAQKNRIV